MRKRVYIAGPITKGDMAHNVGQATRAFHALARAGLAPFCPHWSVYSGGPLVSATGGAPYALAEALPTGTTHDDWMGVDLPWVSVADAVLRLPGPSEGADKEMSCAYALGIPVFFRPSDVIAWDRGLIPAPAPVEVAYCAGANRLD
jgi:hypothetical protein